MAGGLAAPLPLAAQGSGPVLPPSCATGQTFSFTGITPPIALVCTAPNVWALVPLRFSGYAMPDNAPVNLFAVPLPTANTGCAVHMAYSYAASGGGSAVAHVGLVIWVVVNTAGTVTASNTNVGDVVVGTGCALGCDTWTTTVAGTSATARGAFNNTLSAVGTLTYRVLDSSCPSVTPL
jgi:hypothetical protein